MVRTSILRWTHKTICGLGGPTTSSSRCVCVCGWVSCWCRGGHCNKWCINGSYFEKKWTHRTKQHLLTATQAWYFWYEGFQRHPLLWPTKNVTIPDHAGASMWDTSNTSNDMCIYIYCATPQDLPTFDLWGSTCPWHPLSCCFYYHMMSHHRRKVPFQM